MIVCIIEKQEITEMIHCGGMKRSASLARNAAEYVDFMSSFVVFDLKNITSNLTCILHKILQKQNKIVMLSKFYNANDSAGF